MNSKLKRCWNVTEPLYVRYHDEEWGVPLHDDRKHFEFLVLDGFQAGLSWALILQRREKLRRAFDGFDPERIASYGQQDVERLMKSDGMIKNRLKIAATVTNAQQFLKLQNEFGSFDVFAWKFVDGKTIHNGFKALSDLPSHTPESDTMSRELRSRGLKFVGPTICYSYMQAAGLVNDHLECCFRYKQLLQAKP